MEFLVITLFVVAFVLFILVNKGNRALESIDPKTLTTEQLQQHNIMFLKRINAAHNILNQQSIFDYDKPKNVALRAKIEKLGKQLEPIKAEYDRRLSERLSKEKGKCSDDRLGHIRKLAHAAYEGGWESSEHLRESDDKSRHQHALISSLLALYRSDPSTPAINQNTVDAFEFETIPFAILPLDEGRAAFVEYLIWRECPSKADMGKLLPAMQNLRTSGFVSNVLASAPKEFFEAGPAWLKFLPEAKRE